jgi:hypothetical protein
MYVCMHACMYVCMYVCMRLSVCMYVWTIITGHECRLPGVQVSGCTRVFKRHGILLVFHPQNRVCVCTSIYKVSLSLSLSLSAWIRRLACCRGRYLMRCMKRSWRFACVSIYIYIYIYICVCLFVCTYMFMLVANLCDVPKSVLYSEILMHAKTLSEQWICVAPTG